MLLFPCSSGFMIALCSVRPLSACLHIEKRLCLSPDGRHQLRLPDGLQTRGTWHRPVLWAQVEGRYTSSPLFMALTWDDAVKIQKKPSFTFKTTTEIRKTKIRCNFQFDRNFNKWLNKTKCEPRHESWRTLPVKYKPKYKNKNILFNRYKGQRLVLIVNYLIVII